MSHDEKVHFTIATKLTGDRELLLFDHGCLEIEDPLINFEPENPAHQHVDLNYDQAIDLRDFLNENLAS